MGIGAPMRALSIRQPWAELILCVRKSIEVRSTPTRFRERIHIYASLGRYGAAFEARCNDEFDLDIESLPRGVLVGTVEITDSLPLQFTDSAAACFEIEDIDGLYGWRLARPERAAELLKPVKHPQPVWFNPF